MYICSIRIDFGIWSGLHLLPIKHVAMKDGPFGSMIYRYIEKNKIYSYLMLPDYLEFREGSKSPMICDRYAANIRIYQHKFGRRKKLY